MDTGMFIKGFGQDHRGEILVTTGTSEGPAGNTGSIFQIQSALPGRDR